VAVVTFKYSTNAFRYTLGSRYDLSSPLRTTSCGNLLTAENALGTQVSHSYSKVKNQPSSSMGLTLVVVSEVVVSEGGFLPSFLCPSFVSAGVLGYQVMHCFDTAEAISMSIDSAVENRYISYIFRHLGLPG